MSDTAGSALANPTSTSTEAGELNGPVGQAPTSAPLGHSRLCRHITVRRMTFEAQGALMNVLTAVQAPPRSTWLISGALVVTLLAAGCGAPPDSGTSGNNASVSASPSRTAVPASPHTSPSPSATSAPPPPTAADGTRYAACAEGTCEVAVSRPVDIAVDGGTLSVTEVKPDDSLDFELTLTDGGQASGTMKGTCGTTATFHRNGGGTSVATCGAGSTPTPPAPEPGALKMQLAGWNSAHAAVLRLVSG